MSHLDPRPRTLAASGRPGRGGSWWLGPWLGGLVAWLRGLAGPGRQGHADAVQAGYALRRRQEANLQRLACPACRPPRPGEVAGDSAGIVAPTLPDEHAAGGGVTYGLAATAATTLGHQRQAAVVGALGHESLEQAHGT
jgi:hypothetical protein